MTHDPRCYRSHDKPLGRDPLCQCDIIAKVREDERSSNFTPDDLSESITAILQAAVERVVALPWTSPTWQAHTERVAIISAIKGYPE